MKSPKIRFKHHAGEEFPNWSSKKIGEILEIKHGKDYKNLPLGDIPVLGTGGIITYVSLFLCNWPCVLIGRKGTINKPQFMDKPFWSVDTLFYSKPKKHNSPRFQYYLFQTINWLKYSEATGVPSLSASTIENIAKSVPCLEEQEKIASFFSTLDKKIELNERKLEALEKLKKGLMQKIFDHEFSFKNKEGKRFPEWSKICLKNILHFQNGINTNKENFGAGIKLISVNEVLSPFPIKYDDISSSVMVDEEVGKKFSVSYGDVLFQRSSETREDAGTSNVYVDNIREAVFGGFVIRGKRIGDYNPIFLHELLRSPKVRQQIIKYAQGAQHINIGQESLEKIEIKLPCREEQEKIAELAIALYKKIELLTNKVEGLKNLKKGFMQQMFV